MNVVLDRLGRFSAGHPWRALVLWATVFIAVVGLAATLGGPAQENWDVPDPARGGPNEFRKVRELLLERVRRLVAGE